MSIPRRTLLAGSTAGAAAAAVGGAGRAEAADRSAAAASPLLQRTPSRLGVPGVAGLHLQFGADPATEMTVSWISPQSVRRPRIHLESPDGGTGRVVDAETRTCRDGLSQREVCVHHARITGLRPDTTYLYSAGHDGAAQETGSFTTAPRGRAAFTFTHGFAAFDVDPGTRGTGRTRMHVTYHTFDGPYGELTPVDAFTLERPRADARDRRRPGRESLLVALVVHGRTPSRARRSPAGGGRPAPGPGRPAGPARRTAAPVTARGVRDARRRGAARHRRPSAAGPWAAGRVSGRTPCRGRAPGRAARPAGRRAAAAVPAPRTRAQAPSGPRPHRGVTQGCRHV